MQRGLLTLSADLPGRLRAYLVRLRAQRLAGALRQYLHHAGALQVVEIVEGVVHALAAHEDTVMSHDHHLGVAERTGDAVSFVVRQCHASVAVVVHDAAVETHGVLVGTQLEPSAFNDGERRCERHMTVEHDFLLATQVHPAVNKKGGGLDLVLALEHLAVLIYDHQIGGGDLGPVQALRVDQELVGMARQLHAEMVAHAFVECHARGHAQRSGEVDPGIALVIALERGRFLPNGLQVTDVHVIRLLESMQDSKAKPRRGGTILLTPFGLRCV